MNTFVHLRGPVERSLKAYAAMGLTFGDFPDFAAVPEKGYTARSSAPVLISGYDAGKIHLLAFQEGDGTGDTGTFGIGAIAIPMSFQHSEKPERVIPRLKTDVVCEGLFPVCSIRDDLIAPFAVSLEELTVNDRSDAIVHAWTLGLKEDTLGLALDTSINVPPRVYMTTGTSADGRRFGDPHAVYCATGIGGIQIVGFLAIKDQNSPLLRLAQSWVRPPGY